MSGLAGELSLTGPVDLEEAESLERDFQLKFNCLVSTLLSFKLGFSIFDDPERDASSN